MHLAPGCTLGTRGPLCDSVALPGTLAGLAVLTVGVHAVGSCPPSCAWGAQGLVCGGSWGRPLSYSWRDERPRGKAESTQISLTVHLVTLLCSFSLAVFTGC